MLKAFQECLQFALGPRMALFVYNTQKANHGPILKDFGTNLVKSEFEKLALGLVLCKGWFMSCVTRF